MAEGYRARIANRAPLVPQGQVDPRGMAALGGVVGLARTIREENRANEQLDVQLQEREAARQRSAATVENMGRLSDMQLQLDKDIEELRQKAPVGGVGHEEAVAKLVRERLDAFEAQLPPDEKLRQTFAGQIDRTYASAVTSERGWAAKASAEHRAIEFDKFDTLRRNQLFSNPTGAALEQYFADMDGFIDLMDADETTKAAYRYKVRQAGTKSTLDGAKSAGNFEGLKSVVASGQLDAWLSPNEKGLYLASADAGIAQREQQAKMAQKEAQANAIRALEAIEVQIANGDDVAPSVMAAAMQAAKDAGVDDARLLKYAYQGEKATYRQAARKMTTRQVEARTAELQAKRAAGKLTAAEERELAIYDSEVDSRDTKKAESISALVRSGPSGIADAVDQLGGMGVDEQERVATKAGRPDLAVLARAPKQFNRDWAIRGHEVRKDRPDDFKPAKTPTQTPDEQIDAILRAELGETIAQVGGSYADFRDTALDFMAGWPGGKWSAPRFRSAIQQLSGGTQRSNGTWQGGIGTVRGRKVELPDRWSAGEFDGAMSRLPFATAIYGRDRPASKADVIRNYRPVFHDRDAEGNYRYRFEDAKGKPLASRNAPLFLMSLPEQP